jgi:hypothetical protein
MLTDSEIRSIAVSIEAILTGRRSPELKVCGVRLVKRVDRSTDTHFVHLTRECRDALEDAGVTSWRSMVPLPIETVGPPDTD